MFLVDYVVVPHTNASYIIFKEREGLGKRRIETFGKLRRDSSDSSSEIITGRVSRKPAKLIKNSRIFQIIFTRNFMVSKFLALYLNSIIST